MLWRFSVSFQNGYRIVLKTKKMEKYMTVIDEFSEPLKQLITKGYGCDRKEWKDDFFRENVMLWMEGDELVGLCISEYGRNDIFIELKLGYEHQYDQMFKWIDTWAAEKKQIEVDVKDSDLNRMKELESRGYVFKEHCENQRTYDLDKTELGYELDTMFRIEAFKENLNYESRVELVRSAFDNTSYTDQNIKRIMASHDYVEELDLCAVNDKGQLVAYCIGWHDPAKNGAGYVEPVGTHADFRRRGLASAIIKECFIRMKKRGIYVADISSEAEPATANYLYDSLNPTKKIKIHKYVKVKKLD